MPLALISSLKDGLGTVPDVEAYDQLKVAAVKPAAAHRAPNKVVIFEVAGGADKGPDGHRIDTAHIVRALEARGAEVELMFYSDSARADLLRRCVSGGVSAFVMRVNPGCAYDDFTDAAFLGACRELHAAGVLAVQHPDAMLAYAPKDTLHKLRGTAVGLPDTALYAARAELEAGLPAALAQADRVLKVNRGSMGEGVWLVRPHGWERSEGHVPGPDALVEVTEMVDNKRSVVALGEFMEHAARIGFEAEHGALVDQRFLPRISEGEVRVYMIRDRPVSVLHKKPAEGQLSATLFSGARYTGDDVDNPKWARLLKTWMGALPEVRELLGAPEYPLLWCADFILDTDEDGLDAYRLGEINATCVGISTMPHLADDIAAAVIATVSRTA